MNLDLSSALSIVAVVISLFGISWNISTFGAKLERKMQAKMEQIVNEKPADRRLQAVDHMRVQISAKGLVVATDLSQTYRIASAN